MYVLATGDRLAVVLSSLFLEGSECIAPSGDFAFLLFSSLLHLLHSFEKRLFPF